ncbi:MAG: glycosyltransferase family 39 protein [Elusimicrobia bacterium]|nr:glycosyltransferase family 39 protein [Elusimicrobiota bacterium]
MTRGRVLAALAVLALAARVAVAWKFGRLAPDGGIPDPDGYHKLAMAALKYHSLATPDGAPTAVRDPVYTLLLAGLYLVTGPSYWAVVVMNVLLGAAMALLAWRLGERLFGERVGALAGLLVAVHPQLVYYTTQNVREIPQAFLVASTAVLAVEAIQRSSKAIAVLAGVSGALVGLINTALLPGIGLVCLGILYAGRRLMKNLLVHAVLYAVACGGLYALWPLRNALVFHKFILGTTEGGCHLYIGLVIPDEHAGTQVEAELTMKDPILGRADLDPKTRDRLCYEATRAYIRERPGGFALRMWKSFLKLWRPVPYRRDYGLNFDMIRWASILSDGWLIPLALIGLILGWRRAPETAIPVIVIAMVSLVYAVFWAVVRYRLPLMSFVCVYASLAVVELWRRKVLKGLA